ncbi:MAG: amidohydrolase family protein, partial [Gammaproteobacteria bacterium]|nr:amidohydrolase family protein [Gammaproteobacteria bacterium]
MSKPVFQMDADWRVFDPDPSKPQFLVPSGAVDAHCHVFGPGERFPYAKTRKYTPCDAPKEKLWELRDFLGFERNVIVQASCHGTDNAALIDALEDADGMARGIAVVSRDVSDAELDAMHAAGVRGVRFNFVKRLVDTPPRDALAELAERIKPLGWHLIIYFESQDLPDLYDFFAALPTTVVVDHMGRPDVTLDPEGDEFGLFLSLLSENENFWCKVSCPDRLSMSG